MIMRPHKSNTIPSQYGLTLVELMVALVLSMLLLIGIIQIFQGSKMSYRSQEGLSRIQENGRFAVDYVSRRVRMAGYLGCLRDATLYNNLNNPNNFPVDLGVGILGFEANGTAPGDTYSITASDPPPSASATDWSPSLEASLVNKVLPGTDVVVVRFASPDEIPRSDPVNDSAQIFVQNTAEVEIGEILVLTDCQKASVFQVTNVTPTGGGGSLDVVHSNSGTVTPGNATPTWGPEQSYGRDSQLMRLQTFVFYIGQGASGRPALFQERLVSNGAAAALQSEELIEGVENMQIVYGVDIDADRQVDRYVTANAVTDWTQVVSARIALLLRSVDESTADLDTQTQTLFGTIVDPVDDRRLRNVFATTVTVRNRVP